MNFNTHELAWCAGFFDGEGSSVASSNRINLSVSQKNPFLLYRFQKAIGGYGGVYGSANGERRDEWRVCNFEEVQFVMCQLWRWLGPFKKIQYKNMIIHHLLVCRKPKSDRKSVKHREYMKRGTKAMQNKKFLWMLQNNANLHS